ncbi:unnamed protein product, partial [Prunus brigantina]
NFSHTDKNTNTKQTLCSPLISLPLRAMDEEYDVIVLGMGLKECILSGLLTSQWMVSRYCIWIGMTTMEESPLLLILTRFYYIHVYCYLEREREREGE